MSRIRVALATYIKLITEDKLFPVRIYLGQSLTLAYLVAVKKQ